MGEQPTFNRAAEETLDNAFKVLEQRGEEYEDSWSEEHMITPFLDQILNRLNYSNTNKKEKRLILLASLCDVKLSRLGGKFKKDTIEDLINYSAALCTLRQEYENSIHMRP